jgi:hypothetical protein
MMVLQLIFGLTLSPVAKYLQFARRILVKVLKATPLAQICLPTQEKLEEYRSAIESCHPVLSNVWSTMDGLKVRIEAAQDEIVQSRFYNGWKSDHFVTGVLCFVPDGTIAIAFYNVPGCCHDSTVADWGDIYTKLERVHDEYGLKCVVDSAFCSFNHDFIIKSSQDDLTADPQYENLMEQQINIAEKREATSMRQSAEWGMRAVQSSFPRLKDIMQYEERGERRIIFDCFFLLFNLRSRLVGINQITSVYMPSLTQDANLEFAGL